MALSSPRTALLTAIAGFTEQTFLLKSRQELSTQASGVVRGKDLGSALWLASYSSGPIPNDDAVAYEALLNSLDGVIEPFELFDLRRPSPRVSGGASAGTLAVVNANNKAVTIGGLTTGQILSAGDYISFTYASTSRALHQIVETVVAGTQCEVRPHIRPGFTIGVAVNVGAARGLFTLLPNSIDSRAMGGLHSVVSFQAIQYLA